MSSVARVLIVICVAFYEVLITWRGLKAVSFPNLFPYHSYTYSSDISSSVSKDVWPWNLLITSFLQSRYLHEHEWTNEKSSHDRQSGLTWTNEDDV